MQTVSCSRKSCICYRGNLCSRIDGYGMYPSCIRGTDEQFLAVLASFAVGAFRILPSLGRISSSLNSLTNSMPSINALYEQVIQAEEHAKRHPEMLIEADKPKLKFGLISMGSSYHDENHDKREEIVIPQFHKVLELKDISFWYKEELGYILEHINLTIKKDSRLPLSAHQVQENPHWLIFC